MVREMGIVQGQDIKQMEEIKERDKGERGNSGGCIWGWNKGGGSRGQKDMDREESVGNSIVFFYLCILVYGFCFVKSYGEGDSMEIEKYGKFW